VIVKSPLRVSLRTSCVVTSGKLCASVTMPYNLLRQHHAEWHPALTISLTRQPVFTSPHRTYPMTFITWSISRRSDVCSPRLRCSLAMRPRRLRCAWFSRLLRHPARRRSGSIKSPRTHTGYDIVNTEACHSGSPASVAIKRRYSC